MKALFWSGLALIVFTLYGGQPTGVYLHSDWYLIAGLVLIVASMQWELITLFSIMAALFINQVVGADYLTATIGLILLAPSSAVIGCITRKG